MQIKKAMPAQSSFNSRKDSMRSTDRQMNLISIEGTSPAPLHSVLRQNLISR